MAEGIQLSEDCRIHLETALETDDPTEKNFHIRQVLQLCGTAGTAIKG